VLAFELQGTVAIRFPRAKGPRVSTGQVVAELDDGLERAVLAGRLSEARAAEATLALLRAGSRRSGQLPRRKLRRSGPPKSSR